MRILVAIASYKRPVGLRNTLTSLMSQTRLPDHIAIIDNDPAGSARMVVADFPSCIWRPEPAPGIASARNRAVAEARRLAVDAIAFIDDDEIAQPDWLAALEECMVEQSADAVSGPVHPVYDPRAQLPVPHDSFFASPTHLEGAGLKRCSTGNVLIRLRCLPQGDSFRVDFGISGGSDSELFERLHRNGSKLVWTNRAQVLEHLSLERLNAGWISRRLERFGNTDGRISLLYRPKIVVALAALLRIVTGYPQHLFAGIHRRRGSWQRSSAFLRGKGMWRATRGGVLEEYKR